MLTFADTSNISAELLFQFRNSNNAFLLESSGNLKIGKTEIQDCEVVLSPFGMMLNRGFEIFPGNLLNVQFTLVDIDFKLSGKATFFEEINTELISGKQIVTNFDFYLPVNGSIVSCDLTMSIPDLNLQVHSIEKFELVSAETLRICLLNLRASLTEKIKEAIKTAEWNFSEISIGEIEEDEHAILDKSFQNGYRQFVDQSEKTIRYSSDSNSDYLRGYVHSSKKSENFKSNVSRINPNVSSLQRGYLQNKKPTEILKGYVNPSNRPEGKRASGNGYLVNSWSAKNTRTTGISKNVSYWIGDRPTLDVMKHYLPPNYLEIEKYANRILFLKEILRCINSKFR